MSKDRKLAAIMFTDIVGFTRMMSSDEEKAMQVVERNRSIMKPIVDAHKGDWLKEMGDGSLCSFNSAVEAVACAIEIQQALQSEMEYKIRIGIHLGDVVFSDNDIYGDGVNVAARIEPLAEPGSICISAQVYDTIRSRADIKAASLGEHELKNVGRPIEVYALNAEGLPIVGDSVTETESVEELNEPIVKQIAEADHQKKAVTGKRSILMTAALIIAILVIYMISQESISSSLPAQGAGIQLAYDLDFTEWTGEDYQPVLNELQKLQSRGQLRIYPSAFKEIEAEYAYLNFVFDSDSKLSSIILKTSEGFKTYPDLDATQFDPMDKQIIFVRCDLDLQ